MSDDDPTPPEIKITDRRSFSPDGSRRAEEEATARTESAPAAPAEPDPAARADAQLPGVDFAQIVISFRTSALLDLGLIQDPALPGQPIRLEGARQMIDILSMLREKTRGNLDRDEQELLEQVIEELQLHWVRVSQSAVRSTP